MKFTKSIISMAFLAVAAMFTACNEDGYWDKAATESNKYSFAQTTASYKLGVSDVLTQVAIPVLRTSNEAAATLPVTVEVSDENVLSCPTEVAFAAGSNSAELVISVGELQMGQTYTATVAMDSTMLSASGKAAYTLTIAKDYTWTLTAKGTYTYSLYWSGDDTGLPVYKAEEKEGLYKISKWGYGVDYQFELDKATGDIVVANNYTGYDHSEYGSVYVVDYMTYTGGEAPVSYYEDGVCNFAVFYYVSAGYFGYGYETFAITDGEL